MVTFSITSLNYWSTKLETILSYFFSVMLALAFPAALILFLWYRDMRTLLTPEERQAIEEAAKKRTKTMEDLAAAAFERKNPL